MTTYLTGMTGTSVLIAMLRIAVGTAFVAHGLPKVKGGWKQSGQWVQSMGIPATTAVLVTILEFVGGIFLILGFIVPPVAGLFVIQMLAITVMKKLKMNAVFIGNKGQASYEMDILYLLLALVLLVMGAGAASLDSIVGI